MFLYDEYRRWWTRNPSLTMNGTRDELDENGAVLPHSSGAPNPAPDPVWRAVRARRKRSEETGLPL